MGIPIVVNLSWLLTLVFVTSMLALTLYPDASSASNSPYRDDHVLHWVMAIAQRRRLLRLDPPARAGAQRRRPAARASR